jgi:hypothetical protein
MIKFRPHRNTPSASAKDEQIFSNFDDMFGYLYDHMNRIVTFIGSPKPVKRKDIIIDGNRDVYVNRMNKPVFIGKIEE